jgi:hypothetical protein
MAKLERSREALADAKTPAEKSFYGRLTAELQACLLAMKAGTPELPTITFDDHPVIHDAAHELQLVFKGRAHNAGDSCVYCSQKRMIATADVASDREYRLRARNPFETLSSCV